MIVDNGKYYLYRHIRLDKNEPFYIGIGGKESDKGGYYRANRVSNRNFLWNKIFNFCEKKIRVEIIAESDDWSFIKEKEKEFIALYGRKNNNTGILSNLTNGGDGALGAIYTEERRKKQSEALKNSPFNLKGKKLPDWWKDKIRQSKFGADNPMFGKHSPQAKKVINVITKQVFDSIKDAASSIGIKDKLLYQYLDGSRINKTHMLYFDKYNRIGYSDSLLLINQSPKFWKGNSKSVIDTESGKEYLNAKIAAKELGWNDTYLRSMLAGSKINRTTLKYKNG